MKGKNKLFRTIVSPIILMLIITGSFYQGIRRFLLFMQYGGEFITHEKDDRANIEKIYQELKSNHVNNQTLNTKEWK